MNSEISYFRDLKSSKRRIKSAKRELENIQQEVMMQINNMGSDGYRMIELGPLLDREEES